MELEVGAIVTGKVTGITKFGAFVLVAPGRSGLVHISEIANTYVNDVHDHLTVGQEVSVKILSIDDAGRINLSIKQTAPAARPQRPRAETPTSYSRQAKDGESAQHRAVRPQQEAQPTVEPSFEDKLKRFMQDSDSKIAGLRQYADKKGSRRRR